MVLCVPVTHDGQVGSWGRAAQVAVADAEAGRLIHSQEFDVGWDALHDAGTEGSHHARVARFLREHGVELVVAHHVGPDMAHLLGRMGLAVQLAAAGDARRTAILAARAAAGPLESLLPAR